MIEWENLLRLAERNGVRLNKGFRTVPRHATRGAQAMTESNTGSDIGPNSPRGEKPVGVPLRDHKSGETRIAHSETRRQRMTRVIKTVNTQTRNKRKKR